MDFEDKNIKTIIKELSTKTKDSRAYKIYTNRLNKKVKEIVRYRENRANPTSLIILDMLKKIDRNKENNFKKILYKRIFKYNKETSNLILKENL